MDRRDFLATSLGTVVAGATATQASAAADNTQAGGAPSIAIHPRDVKLCVKPVMVNLIHTGEWQGPCRWDSVSPAVERAKSEQSFARWSKQLKAEGLGRPEHVPTGAGPHHDDGRLGGEARGI